MSWRKRKQRQGLIISVAAAWHRLSKKANGSPGLIEAETLITNLTRQVSDARVVLDRFFVVKRIGYNRGGDDHAPSIITPRKLARKFSQAIEELTSSFYFDPGPVPVGSSYTLSEVTVQAGTNLVNLTKRLKEKGRDDLVAPVTWLLKQDKPITFYFARSGTLQSRDKSIWPIRSIELWPGWLRHELFGTVVDIENAFIQFLVQNLELKYADNPRRLELKYPDLLRADQDKQNFREELCRDHLRLPITDENIKIVKTLIMSLANGSNATAAILTNGSGRSSAAQVVHEACPHLSPTELISLGNRLSAICKQFKGAKRDLCMFVLNARPTRENQRKIFRMYFDWERDARYKIWNLAGKTGLQLHDGIDGVNVPHPKLFAAEVFKSCGLRVSVEQFHHAA